MPKETARQVFTRLADARLQDVLPSLVTAEDNSKCQVLQRLCGRTAGVRLPATNHRAFLVSRPDSQVNLPHSKQRWLTAR